MQCVVAENIHIPLRRATEIPRGGGDVEKEAITEGVGGCLQRSFSRGLSKIGELSLNNSFSVEKAYINYFTVTGVSKQPLLFALIIFFLGSAKCIFSIVFFNTIQSNLFNTDTERDRTTKRIREVSVLERSI